MAAHTISVTVGSNSIQVAPDTLFMTTDDEVSWTGSNPSAFHIEFADDLAFGQKKLLHGTATGRNKPKIKGRHKYTVISADNPSLRLDPDIIVGDPPTVKP